MRGIIYQDGKGSLGCDFIFGYQWLWILAMFDFYEFAVLGRVLLMIRTRSNLPFKLIIVFLIWLLFHDTATYVVEFGLRQCNTRTVRKRKVSTFIWTSSQNVHYAIDDHIYSNRRHTVNAFCQRGASYL